MTRYRFHDGWFTFWVGRDEQGREWVFRVREDRTPEERAAEKSLGKPRPATDEDIATWQVGHYGHYPVLESESIA